MFEVVIEMTCPGWRRSHVHSRITGADRCKGPNWLMGLSRPYRARDLQERPEGDGVDVNVRGTCFLLARADTSAVLYNQAVNFHWETSRKK